MKKINKNTHSERYCLKCEVVRTFRYKENEKHSLCIFCGGYKAISTFSKPNYDSSLKKHYKRYKTSYLKEVIKLFGEEICKRRIKNVKKNK